MGNLAHELESMFNMTNQQVSLIGLLIHDQSIYPFYSQHDTRKMKPKQMLQTNEIPWTL